MASIQPSLRDWAILDNQLEHHQSKTFQEEFLAILEKHGIEYDPRYVWG